MAAIDIINRVFREFKRYTGDGLPGEPINAPLPEGDPLSGVHNPKKSELRSAFGAALEGSADAAEAAEGFRDEAETFRDEAAGYAAALNIPEVSTGDAGKVLRAKEDETGSEWSSSGLRGIRCDVVDVAGLTPATDYQPGDIVNGEVLSTGDVVLRATLGGSAADGVYLVPPSGATVRHPVFDTLMKISGGLFTVANGTVWQNIDSLGGTFGTTPLHFSDISTNGGFPDTVFVVYDDGDPTKRVKLQASGVPASSTRLMAAPLKDGTLAVIEGTVAADNAAVGQVGEFREDEVLIGAAVALTSATAANVASLSLPAGDWEVSGIFPDGPNHYVPGRPWSSDQCFHDHNRLSKCLLFLRRVHTRGIRLPVRAFVQKIGVYLGFTNIVNTAVPGHTTSQTRAHWASDLATYKPNSVFLAMTPNNSAQGISINQSRIDLVDMIDRAQDTGAKVTLASHNIWADTTYLNGYAIPERTLMEELGGLPGVQYVDIFADWCVWMLYNNYTPGAANPAFAALYAPDGNGDPDYIHPSAIGHQLIFDLLLKNPLACQRPAI